MDAGRDYRHLIIGGTIKGATSSVFAYLSAHPEICGSSVKETFFFTHEYSGNIEQDRQCYQRYFKDTQGCKAVCEASPNYLGYTESVAPRIKALLPDARLLFILRNPADRLFSYFNFARGKLELPREMTFDSFVGLCEKYTVEHETTEELGLAVKHLRALELGNYSHFLKNYYNEFDDENIKIMLFDSMRKDPIAFMADICEFISVDPEFYQSYTFGKSNVTFAGKLKSLHFIAMLLNKVLESFLRQRPELKARLVSLYKKINQSRGRVEPMSASIRARLNEYYAPANRELAVMFSGQPLPPWLRQD